MYCRKCAYDLRSLTVNRCPECGQAFEPENPRTYRRRPQRFSSRQKCVAGCFFIIATYALAYLALVEVGTTTSPNRLAHPIQFLYHDPTYRYGSAVGRIVFWPANYLDRRVRPGQWREPAWRARHWSYPHYPRGVTFGHAPTGQGVRFHIADPSVVQVWTMRFSPAIKVASRPILVVRYRAQNTDPGPGWYMLWIDDGTGPNSGGLIPIRLSDIKADGLVHEIRRDIRQFNPQGDLFYFAVGVASGAQGSAIFDLLEIRFEPPNPSPSN